MLEELLAVQGNPVELDGYFQPSVDKLREAMRPSKTLNSALAGTSA
ncbi:MAG: NADP-dependent isocitrate dehydrogenase [Dietzia cercidiphylli]